MPETDFTLTRRHFLKTTTAAALGAAVSPLGAPAAQRAKYTRYNVMSDGGRRALASYARGVEAMLKLPADHPQNWFRNAFIHLMDCPHGNWWFYVWHRGYVGYFEQTIRKLSGDRDFAIPYWDWTTLPQIPDSMFRGPLTPTHEAFEPYTRNLSVFTSFIQPALTTYWNNLTADQQTQLDKRGYTAFDKMWNDVTGNGDSGNMAYANTCGARYLSRDNPKLDEKTAKDVSPFIVASGLSPTKYYSPVAADSFSSSKTESHNDAPGKNTKFSVLEGFPHNKVHNYIGGVGPLGPGPYGNMTNFLSPVDPIFFLHHANMDRLWDVWTRRQKAHNRPYLPEGNDLDTLSREQFLFFVDGDGNPVPNGRAGDYYNTERFEYDYEPGFGEGLVKPPPLRTQGPRRAPVRGVVRGNAATLTVPSQAVAEHLAAPDVATLIAEVTVPHPGPNSPDREFDVVVGAPPGVTEVSADSPHYAGTIAFFGTMKGMAGMAMDATFAVPLPKAPQAFRGLTAAANTSVQIRILPTNRRAGRPPVLKAVTIHAR